MSALARFNLRSTKEVNDYIEKAGYDIRLAHGAEEERLSVANMKAAIKLIMNRPAIETNSAEWWKMASTLKNMANSLLGSSGLMAIPSLLGNLINTSMIGALHTMPILRKLTYKNAGMLLEEYEMFKYAVQDNGFSRVFGFGEEITGLATDSSMKSLDSWLITSDQLSRWTQTLSLNRQIDYQSKIMTTINLSNQLVKDIKTGKGLGRYGIRGTPQVKARIEKYIADHAVVEKGLLLDKLKTMNMDRWIDEGMPDYEAIDTFFAILRDGTSRITNEALAGHQIPSLASNISVQLMLQFKAILIRAYEKQWLYYKRGFSEDTLNKSFAMLLGQ